MPPEDNPQDETSPEPEPERKPTAVTETTQPQFNAVHQAQLEKFTESAKEVLDLCQPGGLLRQCPSRLNVRSACQTVMEQVGRLLRQIEEMSGKG